jgi:hypothetical protein
MLVYFTATWHNLWPFGIMYGRLVWFVVLWYIFPVLVCLDQVKSGNPACYQSSDPLRGFPFCRHSKNVLEIVALRDTMLIDNALSKLVTHPHSFSIKVARWYIFKPKIPIREKKFMVLQWYILWPICLLYICYN